jgi:hypothetical protein
MDTALVETEKPPRARNLDEAETKDLGGYDRGLSKTAKSCCPRPRQLICDAKCLWRRSSFVAALDQAEVKQLRSNGHFSVDGTLIEMWASMKSFQRKDGEDTPQVILPGQLAAAS